MDQKPGGRRARPRGPKRVNQSNSAAGSGTEATEVAILLWAAAAGTSFFTLAPTLVGALIDHLRLSVHEVGLITSGELAGSALGSALVLVYGRLFSARVILATSLVIVGICNLATAAAHHFVTIALCRVVAGLGAGLAFSVVNAAAARARKPGLMFAAISVVQMVFGVAGFIGAASVIGAFGLAGIFMILGGCALGCAVASSLWVTGAPVHGSRLCSSMSITPRGALLLLSLFATYLTSTAVWTYLERIGVEARLASHVISLGLSIGMFGGVLGSVGATLLLLRARGPDYSLIGGAALMAISTGLLMKASAPAVYLIALFGFNGALSFVTPLYQTRVAAESGGDGRILVALLAMNLGLIGGPILGAGLVGLGYGGLIQITAALFVAATLLALGSARGSHAPSTVRWIQRSARAE